MAEKTHYKIILILIVILLILTFVSSIVYADDYFYPYDAAYLNLNLNTYRYVLPYEALTINFTTDNWSEKTQNLNWVYCADKRSTEFGVTEEVHRYNIIKNELSNSYMDSYEHENRFGMTKQIRRLYTGTNGYYTYKVRLVNNSDRIAAIGLSNEGYLNDEGVSIIGGYATYDTAAYALDHQPSFEINPNQNSTYICNKEGSVIVDIVGNNQNDGTLKVELFKVVGTSYSLVQTMYENTFENGYNDFNINLSLPSLELGNYRVIANYKPHGEFNYPRHFDFETVLPDDNTKVRINLGGETIEVDNYYNSIWEIKEPKRNLSYNEKPNLKIIGNKKYLEKQGILELWNYNVDVFKDYNEISLALPYGLGTVFNVYINEFFVGMYEFSNIDNLTFSITIPESKLNRGLNTVYITSHSSREFATEKVKFWKDGGYRYLFSGVDFYYKSIGDNELEHPYEPPIDGGLGDVPPKRSDYPEGIAGDLQYYFATILYYIGMPFRLLFNAINWLLTNFANLFSWVGQLNSMILSWFSFLPMEIRVLLMGVIVCSFIAFVLAIFRK